MLLLCCRTHACPTMTLSTNLSCWCRGAGEVFGRKQSGQEHWAHLHAASLPEDADLLELARSAAADLIATHGIDPASWPQPLLTAIAYSKLPDLDFYEADVGELVAKIAAFGE